MIADVNTIAVYALREALRRKVLIVVLILTGAFLALYGWGTAETFDAVTARPDEPLVREQTVVGATLLGLAMFVTLFLGTVLAVFLTLNAVRGDAERGLLQPLVVRPMGRVSLLLGRFFAAATVCGGYVLLVYGIAVLLTGTLGDFTPDDIVGPGIALAAAVVVVVGVALLGSTVLSATANGIAVFMVFGAGLAAGLMGQIGEALNSDALEDIASIAAWVLPFEALYQQALHFLTDSTQNFERVIVTLGPFGGARDGGPLLWPWAVAYLAMVWAAAAWRFGRMDL
ncbi:ABC transporter permease subunit [Svornostia abyssi]|uniref:ABC transporter permease subunit n=1 Tax=Svornostia abyssi TaxID=2898438 RepID=A0ABY5PJ99_9ACTN|nr:ABC transporter permease subunit [Parviterribacteraceae bacterium J379]